MNSILNFNGKVPKFLFSDSLWNQNYLHRLGCEYSDEIQSIIRSSREMVKEFHCNFTISYFGFIPEVNEILGHKGWICFDNNVYQRKFIELMTREEYEELIWNPLEFIKNKAIFRLYKNTAPENLVEAYKEFNAKNESNYMAQKLLKEKYQINHLYLDIITSPLDVLGDFFRGTKNLLMDMHNCPDLVKEAANSLVDFCYEKALYNKRQFDNAVIMPLHIPSILSTRDFTNFFFPSFHKLIQKLLQDDFIILIMLEGKVERLLDKFFEINSPKVIFHFEEDIPAIVKEKMNENNLISGFFPVHLLKYGTEEECISYAVKLLHIFKGKKYIFTTNKVIYSPTEVNIDKLRVVYQYVEEYGK
ncbi:uroporphyrinogen decarboxylase [Alkalibaculum bacchi]|uniref:Uroporphyrinogen decarboxylase n=1 Tax=Alkalibaculum bacchi TaxID=645887 RepID=A0A366I9V6_9FIRM|nr:uroporphyrinogen decarboxylase family protein [Alkalibaculum bacchi]RBP66721.1 uroporphyrinogen decarboxylase [Alkalibaculum bacchi]